MLDKKFQKDIAIQGEESWREGKEGVTPIPSDGQEHCKEGPAGDTPPAQANAFIWPPRDFVGEFASGGVLPSYFAVVPKVPDYLLLQFFKYEHLPAHSQEVSKLICVLANQLAAMLPCNIETEAALRKLLEAKDCAVRSSLLGSK